MAVVFVGLSGGVDSAVSAALLKEAGHTVVGAFIKIWRPEFIDCPMVQDRLDAIRICAALEIPFREIDLSQAYKESVIDDMITHYAEGITPNPDVLCNRHIKFGAFAQWAYMEGAEYVATGHYAQNKEGRLLRGKDLNKDQSYFLWQLTQADLQRVLFPVGGLAKTDVRTHAARFRLPVATKKDSQGLCFVGDITLQDFLSAYIPLEKGVVVDERGEVLGEHDGAALYTLGERHGFRYAARSADEEARYVIGIDVARNIITVSSDRTRAFRTSALLMNTSWVTGWPEHGASLCAQARYRESAVPCSLEGNLVRFETPHLLPPGQSLVLYDGDNLIGGGIISA